MLKPDPQSQVFFPEDETPLLVVVIDTEAEFEWEKPLSRSDTSVKSVKSMSSMDELFERYRIKPTCVIDYAVADQADGYRPILDRLRSNRCIIGAHLQPWYNPPFEEDISLTRNSYPGNLPGKLEYEKLASLTGTIETNLGVRPRVYRAGRFGVGPNTAGVLDRLGYHVDTSIVPRTDFRAQEGPNFLDCDMHPYWFGPGGRLLEIPVTVGFTGLLRELGPTVFQHLSKPTGINLHLPGVLARSHLLDRIRLSPEGIIFKEMQRLTRSLLRAGCRMFSLTFHSPSLEPGNTPYVRTDDDLRRFIATFDNFCDFFFGEVGGRAVTALEVRDLALRLQAAPVAQSPSDTRDCAPEA